LEGPVVLFDVVEVLPTKIPVHQRPQKAFAWWVATSGADANSDSTATIANADIAIVFCFVDIMRT